MLALYQEARHPVPWVDAPADLPLWCRWAVVVSMDTPLSITAAQARQYRNAAVWPGGPIHRPFIVAADAPRRDVIQRIWSEAWPAGSWLLATPEEIEQ